MTWNKGDGDDSNWYLKELNARQRSKDANLIFKSVMAEELRGEKVDLYNYIQQSRKLKMLEIEKSNYMATYRQLYNFKDDLRKPNISKRRRQRLERKFYACRPRLDETIERIKGIYDSLNELSKNEKILSASLSVQKTLLDVYVSKACLLDYYKENNAKKEEFLEKAQIPKDFRANSVVKISDDGRVNIYFGLEGIDLEDRHGHAVLDRDGNIVYYRGYYDEHGFQNVVSVINTT